MIIKIKINKQPFDINNVRVKEFKVYLDKLKDQFESLYKMKWLNEYFSLFWSTWFRNIIRLKTTVRFSLYSFTTFSLEGKESIFWQ